MSQCKQPGIFPISIHLCYLGCLCVITGRHSKIVVCKDGGEAYTQRGAARVPGELGVIQDQCFWLGKLNRTKVNPPHSGCSLCLGLSQNSRNRWGCRCQLCKLSSNFKWTVWAERKSRSIKTDESGNYGDSLNIWKVIWKHIEAAVPPCSKLLFAEHQVRSGYCRVWNVCCLWPELSWTAAFFLTSNRYFPGPQIFGEFRVIGSEG